MRKYSFVLSALAVTGLTAAAQALPESTYWFDVRPNTGAAGAATNITSPGAPYTIGQGEAVALDDVGILIAGGGRGNGQILRVSPTLLGGQHLFNSFPNFDTVGGVPGTGDANKATGELFLYCDVLANQDSPAGTNDVISSIGLDMAISTSAATPRFEIGSVAYSWIYNDTGGNANFGTANGTSSRTGVVGAKYVKVPVAGTPAVYASAGGLVVGGPYRLGSLKITGAARDAVSCTTAANTHANNSTYNVTMSINNLLVTRTFSTGGNATPEERVSLGYTGGALEADVSGNTVGGAGARDAVIQVRLAHDGNGSGNVNNLDISGANGFNTAQAAGANITQRQRYLFDRNNNGSINNLDISGANGFNGIQATTCP